MEEAAAGHGTGDGICRLPVWAQAVGRLRCLAADPGMRLALTVVLTLRLLLGVAALVGMAVHGNPPAAGDHLDAQTPRSALLWPLVGPFERWDGLWYLHLVRDGYAPRTGDGAYEPLFPLVVKVVSWPLGGDAGLAAWLVVTVALVAALTVVWHLVAGALGAATARLSVLGMAVYPAGFFLLAPYPEAIFLALSAGTVLAASRQRWPLAGGLAALAALCRPQGAVVIVALAVESLLVARGAAARHLPAPARGHHAHVPVTATLRALRGEMLAAWALPIVAIAAWFAACRIDLDLPLGPLTPLRDQWGHRGAWPWHVVADSIHSIAGGKHAEEAGNLLVIAVVVTVLPVMWRLLPRSWTAYTAATIGLALLGEAAYTPLMSWMRYAAVLFPVFALLSVGLLRLPVWSQWALGAGALGLQLSLFDLYVHYTFIA